MSNYQKVEVLIERNFADPQDRLSAMQVYEDMVNYLRAEKAKWILAYCDVLGSSSKAGFTYKLKNRIVWKFQIPNEETRIKFNDIFDVS